MEIEKILEAIKAKQDLSFLNCLSEYDGQIVKNHLPLECCAVCVYYKNSFCKQNLYHVSASGRCSEFDKR